ncbi:MAG: glucosylceramidase [Anaerolineae bacterium]|nr:glucosylceramidase [Anaerolineae bacterium]
MLQKRVIGVLLAVALLASIPLDSTVHRSDAKELSEPAAAHIAQAGTDIPEAAWSRPIGEPFENPARENVTYDMIDDGPYQGAPLGGFGAGTFARTYAGSFARWHIDTGIHIYYPDPATMFSVYTRQGDETLAQALSTGKPEQTLSAWQWEYPVGAGTYYALYPRSWFVYDWDQLPVKMTVEQFSPIIPGDYQVTSYPVALYNWTATNPGDEPVTVGVMFTTSNLIGQSEGRIQDVHTETIGDRRVVGIEMSHTDPFNEQEGQGTMAIAALEAPGVSVSYRSVFNSQSDGAEIWQDFAADGALDNRDNAKPSGEREPPGAGIAVTFDLDPGETLTVPFVSAWDFPVMMFGQGESWFKRYTAFFGRDGDNAWDIATDGLAHIDEWRDAIEAWQAPILADETRPLWYKTALFNELYYVADGGTAWEHGRVGEPEPDPDYMGRFAYLECFDYYWYNTFDVDFYASFALMELWPEIELRIMRDFAETIPQEDPTKFQVGYSGKMGIRKAAGAVPHDMGSPFEAPWLHPNGFTWQDTNKWKDLNPKFVLRLYRDAVLLEEPGLVDELWPMAVMAMDYLAAMDENGDSIPENDGIPDQTYDTWPATGVSAYSGGLWLAALAAMHDMALMIGDEDAAADYAAQLDIAQAVYEDTLWNGQYYEYDETSDSIMADQLAGEWYARVSGLSVLPDDRVNSALETIYDYNVLQFHDGQMGAVNGMESDGKAVNTQQGSEVWGGTTNMLAAHMILRGLDDIGWGTVYGFYKYVYETGGLWFRTPEAWDGKGGFRASMYMRPLSIWAIETALAQR